MAPTKKSAHNLRDIPSGIWVLGFVSMLMDISSEMIHSLLPIFLVTVLGTSALTVGVIVAVHSLKRLRPNVMVLLDQDKVPLSKFRTLDLSQPEYDDRGQSLSVKGGLPAGAYNIDLQELFLD